ncbi:methionine synthase reductase isoform X2 [Cylas formicarius]|uniref:methionine synthase reductase isoform X2 n=1 Tax=Cylas formicarius TaxID=197179 RepID=UPI002958AEE7|nr:methionine synthase reductase isoform X2 [Cylas formicarius]
MLKFTTRIGNEDAQDDFEFRSKPFAAGPVYLSRIDSFEKLTRGEDVKSVYMLNLCTKDVDCEFLPGDTLAILPRNDENEVDSLLFRLNVDSVSDNRYCLVDDCEKPFNIPKHVPREGTLRNVFMSHINIRSMLKKVFLKKLLFYTTDCEERRVLEDCASANSKQYELLISECPTLLHILDRFPSCSPPIELILHYSSPLLPRYFSIASSPLQKDTLSIIFSVVEFENSLKGVCTGWLEKLLNVQQSKVPFYFRKPTGFRMDSPEESRVLIAAGTGIAPFLGFLRHKSLLEKPKKLGGTYLYYGCRYKEGDFLCAEELRKYVSNGILAALYPAFSRESTSKCYVQNELSKGRDMLVDLILNDGALVYVCGNKSVAKDVKETLVECFAEHLRVDVADAAKIIGSLIKEKKYLVDTWL